MTPRLSLGGEAFYLGLQRKSGFGLAARHVTDKSIATCQLASTAMVSLSYVHKVSEKVGCLFDIVCRGTHEELALRVPFHMLFRP